MTVIAPPLLERIRSILVRDLHVDVPAPDVDLLASGRLDSLGVVELILQLERRFGVKVDADDVVLDNFRSVQSITDFVDERQRADMRPEDG